MPKYLYFLRFSYNELQLIWSKHSTAQFKDNEAWSQTYIKSCTKNIMFAYDIRKSNDGHKM